MGHVLACCRDESGACLLVEVGTRVGQHSIYSSKWHMQGSTTKYMWFMHEAAPCATWQWQDDHVTVVAM